MNAVLCAPVVAPNWLVEMLHWKPATSKSADNCKQLFGEPVAPNIADVGGFESLKISGEIYRLLNVAEVMTRDRTARLVNPDASSGTALERGVEADILDTLGTSDPTRQWIVTRSGDTAEYAQFKHLASLQQLFEEQPTLRATLGRDYQVKTDVYVGVKHPADISAAPFLHAAISCKWTIRSDRVQNVRHEFSTLVRNRRGRLPHLVLVTAEPLPSRLISIARGTGEVDAVYHLLFDELDTAVSNVGGTEQRSQWAEMVEQDRILPYSSLACDLVVS